MTMVNNNCFSVKRDNEMVEGGGCFCQACLAGKHALEQSYDQRYCQHCYEILKAAADILPVNKRPSWRPKAFKKALEKQYHIPQDEISIMSTSESKEFEVDIIIARATARPLSKRGPKFTELPEDLIRELASQNQGAKAIATRLKAEGIEITYRTIQRRLAAMTATKDNTLLHNGGLNDGRPE